MSLTSIISKVFGTKADRDYKAVKPLLQKVLDIYPSIDSLNNDALRARTEELKRQLREVEAPFENRIAEIKTELDGDIPVSEKEKLAGESDKLVKDEDAAIEECLNKILTEALDIMKSNRQTFKRKRKGGCHRKPV